MAERICPGCREVYLHRGESECRTCRRVLIGLIAALNLHIGAAVTLGVWPEVLHG